MLKVIQIFSFSSELRYCPPNLDFEVNQSENEMIEKNFPSLLQAAFGRWLMSASVSLDCCTVFHTIY